MSYGKAWRRPFVFTGDSRGHEFLYDAQAIFKILSILSFAVLVFAIFLHWPGLGVLGGLFVASVILWMTTTALEHRARHQLRSVVNEHEAHELEHLAQDAVERTRDEHVARVETRFALAILVALVLGALAVAALLFRPTFGLGALLVFAYLVAFGAPYWLAAIHERGEDERNKQD
ncbi:MAG: hypothetical protein R3B81_14940 [bacterium]